MSETAASTLGLWSHAATLCVYLLLGLLAILWRREVTLVIACVLTGIWALDILLLFSIQRIFLWPPVVYDVLQSLAWIAFLWQYVWSKLEAGRHRFITVVVVALAVAGLVFLAAKLAGLVAPTLGLMFRILLSVVGLLFLENMLRNTARGQRWGIKFFVIGLGGLFAFDLFFYANILLTGSTNFGHIEARGLVYALAGPLIGIAAHRSRLETTSILVSRQVAFYSSTVLFCGIYILAMAAAALLIRHVGGDWGTAIQLIFVFGALLLLLVLLSSGTYRSYVNIFIQKHFFRYRYDYRHEWLRFTRAISDSRSAEPLAERIVRAMADIVESPAGALWLRDGETFSVTTSWNMAVSSVSQAEAVPMAELMVRREWVVLLHPEGSDIEASKLALPSALTRAKEAWIVVPLLHHAELTGFIMLARPRAPKALVWEDFDLMRTVGRQAASYLAEQQASLALAQAQQFERFNQRSAFVLHDIKNLVSQLSLLTRNMERHGDKPEFRRDVALTLDNVVAKMQQMIDRLSAKDAEDASQAPMRIELAPLLGEVAASRAEFYPEEGTEGLAVQGDRDRLASLFGHLVNNAREAVQGDEEGWVRLSLLASNDRAVVEVSDNGPGMDEAFIRNHLFTPFRSTKSGGFGIGTHQCRVYARELGGDLEVVSSPGAGTTMRVLLPIAPAEPRQAPAVGAGAGE